MNEMLNPHLSNEKMDLNKKLLCAVQREDLIEVTALLASGANPDCYFQLDDGFDGSLLHFTKSGKIAAELIRNGAFVDSRDWCGSTPLLQAVRNRCVDVVKVLLHYGASVITIDGLGESTLACAIKTCDGDTEIIRELIKYGANVNNDFLSVFPPLHIAVTCNKLEVIDELIKQGACIHQRNNGLTALHCALKNPTVTFPTIKKLLDSGANCNEELDIYPLELAVLHRDVDTVRELIKHGAKISKEMDSRNPLYKCVFYRTNHLPIFQELFYHGAKAGSYLDTDCMSPVAYAVSIYMRHTSIPSWVELMLKYSTIDFLHLYEQYSHDERQIYLGEMANFATSCILEAQEMHKEMIDENCSLYDYLQKFIDKNLGALDEDMAIKNKIFNAFVKKKFPIYRDIIVSLIGREFCMYRISLFNIFALAANSKTVSLVPDTIQNILFYLSDSDLLNLICVCYEKML